MPNHLTMQNSITIKAPIAKVWDALTQPDLIKQWFFGVDTFTDWKEGSPLVHKGEWQGRPYVDKGTILKFEPPTLLQHSHWSEGSGLQDQPENYQTVTYSLAESNGATELVVREVNLPSEDARVLSETSWTAVLNALKQLLEK